MQLFFSLCVELNLLCKDLLSLRIFRIASGENTAVAGKPEVRSGARQKVSEVRSWDEGFVFEFCFWPVRFVALFRIICSWPMMPAYGLGFQDRLLAGIGTKTDGAGRYIGRERCIFDFNVLLVSLFQIKLFPMFPKTHKREL